jgi:hypothetical protein
MSISMRLSSGSSVILGALSVLSGCGSSASKPDDPRGNILLQDANNYRTTASLDIPTVETAAATDLDICWGNIVDDLQCHAVAAMTDLDNVSLLRIAHLSQEQVAVMLANGQLSQSQVAGYLDFHTNDSTTCMKLSQLSFNGTLIDVPSKYAENADYTYLMLFATGTTPGQGARAMTFLKPTSASTNTKVEATTGCGLLDFSADLASLTHLPVPAAAPWVLDWRDITRDGQGHPEAVSKIDGVTIGFYAGKTVPDLQAQIFDIEMIATTLWDLKIAAGKTADLALAKDRASGAAFAGFDRPEAGIWMLALTCSKCQTPAPVVMTILAPGPGGV